MQVIGRLLLMFLLQGGSCEAMYCTEQRGNVHVEEKGAVTISCNFTYPQQREKPREVSVSWRQGNSNHCGNGPFIYNHTEGWTDIQYRGRISPVGDPNTDGRATITIKALRRMDGPMFCCRVEIHERPNIIQAWQNNPGTSILFKDELSVEQADVVPAVIGESITIPCLVHYRGSDIIEEVTWTVGVSDLCSENNEEVLSQDELFYIRGGWSVVNFPRDLSLRIRRVTSEEASKRYCCKVRTKLRNNNVASPIRGTELVVFASNSTVLAVVQPQTVTPDKDGSATLSCTFTYRRDVNPLWIEVFWRVGSPTGLYAYQPFTNTVHSSYRGRTELRGAADLHIKSVTDTDHTTYYCFVMLKICTSNTATSSTIQYGGGTKLDSMGFQESVPNSEIVTIIIFVGVKNLIVLALVIVFLFYLKKRSLQPDVDGEINLQTLGI